MLFFLCLYLVSNNVSNASVALKGVGVEGLPFYLDEETAVFTFPGMVPMFSRYVTVRRFDKKPEWMLNDNTGDRSVITKHRSRCSFGVGLSGAICYTGADFVRAKKPGEEFTIDLTRWLYWMNSIRGRIVYWFDNNWALGIGVGYAEAELSDRVTFTLNYSKNLKTTIESVPITFSVLNSLSSKTWDLSVNLEYYIGKIHRVEVNPYWGPPQEYMDAKINARGFGIALAFEWHKMLYNGVYFSLDFSPKLGYAKEYSAVLVPADTERDQYYYPLNINFSGLYVWIEVGYEL